ncbi:hypothetical protein QUA56_05905 [Microcoleus sp. N3A4]|uniref:hypothetical protein n=1 Tax=Microcoleus sp. N3A4 TaxID=3055379 RepID=UPI002FD413E4
MTQTRQNTPIDAWIAAHNGETFRLLAGNTQGQPSINLQDACENFDRAVALAPSNSPNFIWAIAHRGLTLRQLGNLDEAINDFQVVVKKTEGYPWVYAQLGETYRFQMARSKPDQVDEPKDNAIKNFQKAIELNGGEYAWAHAHLGVTYCQLALLNKNPQKAAEYWKLAQKSLETAIAQTKERYAWAYAYAYIVEFSGFKNFETARQYMDRARLLDPRVIPQNNFQMGLLYQHNGEYEEAIAKYTQGLQQEAEKRFVLYGIAVATVRQKGLNEAARIKISIARQELERSTDSFALYMLAALATLEVQYDQARKYAQKARCNSVNEEADSSTGKLIYLEKNDLSWLGLNDEELNFLKP